MLRRLVLKRQIFTLLAIGIAVGAAFQNCAPASFEMAPQKSGGTENDYDLETPEELLVSKACENPNLFTQTATINFPRPEKIYNNSRCNWNTAGNGDKKNDFFQARLDQIQNVSLPAGAKVCDVKFSSAPQDWEYDDHVFVMMNDVVLASSHPVHENLQQQNGLTIYEWANIYEQRWTQIPAYIWCEGMDRGLSQCSWPASQEKGTISLSFDPKLFQKIAARDLSRTVQEFKIVTTGDNDPDRDCDHSDLTFDVEIKYAK